MKYPVCLCAFVFVGALGARAQDLPAVTSAAALDAPAVGADSSASAVASDSAKTFASVALAPGESFSALPAGAAPSAPARTPSPRQVPINVTPSYSFQAYLGYTFVRFYAFPGRVGNRNGADVSVAYFVKKGLLGVEGAVTGAFGSVGKESSDFAFVGGGPRVRWAAPRGIELWAHGLFGEGHFGPRITDYSQNGFAYEVGGGADIPAHFKRFAYRVEADMIGSTLYSTTQYSPKISAGIVFNF
jgi:hypothetical protein